VGFFEYGLECPHGEARQDRSDWIASIYCINPGLNGSLGTYFFGLDENSHRFERD